MVCIDPPLEVTLAELLLELHHIILKPLQFLELPSLQVPLNVLLIDLIDGQLAQIIFGATEVLLPVLLIEIEEAVGPKFLLVDGMLIALVKDVVENSFSFDVEAEVNAPYLMGCLLVGLIAVGEVRHDDELLEGIVEVFLVIVEGRVLSPLDFLFLPWELIHFLCRLQLPSTVIYRLAGRGLTVRRGGPLLFD